MGRYRAPQPKSSPYITRDGFESLRAEEKSLWKRRKVVTAAVSVAAAEGDRSENAEYIYRKKELREIDRRIRYLQKRLPDLTIVDAVGDRNKIYFGAIVTLCEPDGNELRYRIVGADEINPRLGHISIDSPMARALLRKMLDDEVVLPLGDSTRHYEIIAIDYPDQPRT